MTDRPTWLCPEQEMPTDLRFSERRLWDDCPQARTVLGRLARTRRIAADREDALRVIAETESLLPSLVVNIARAALAPDERKHR